jgi:hypothetical protein
VCFALDELLDAEGLDTWVELVIQPVDLAFARDYRPLSVSCRMCPPPPGVSYRS